jgi:hypothetical protein
MTKAICMVWHRCVPHRNEHYQTLFDAWYKCWQRWGRYFDKVYIIDSDWGFEPISDPKFTIIKRQPDLHWNHFNAAIPIIKGETILFMDNDMLIYDPSWVRSTMFNFMENKYDIAAIFDNSGTDIHQQFPLMAANHNRDVRRRFALYFFMVRRMLLNQLETVDFSPKQIDDDKHLDSAGQLTIDLLALNPKVMEIPDDRTTLRINDDLSTNKDSWLDGPGFQWSEPLDQASYLGYYHLRNFGRGLYLVDTFCDDQEAYQQQKQIMPRSEALRLLGWLWQVDKIAGKLDEWQHEIIAVVRDLGIPDYIWDTYMRDWEDYHRWVREF